MLNSKMLLPAKTVLHLGSMWMWSSFTLITHNLSTKMYAQQQQNALLFFFTRTLLFQHLFEFWLNWASSPKSRQSQPFVSAARHRHPHRHDLRHLLDSKYWEFVSGEQRDIYLLWREPRERKKKIKLLIGVFKYKSVLIGHMSQDSILHSIHMWSQ